MSTAAMRSLDAETKNEKTALTVSENFVLTILSWRLYKGVCNPSVYTIAKRTSMKPETVRTALKGLQKKGRITAIGKTRLGVTLWRINVPNNAQQETTPRRGSGIDKQLPPLGEATTPRRGGELPPVGGGNRKHRIDKSPEVEKTPDPENRKSGHMSMAEALRAYGSGAAGTRSPGGAPETERAEPAT